MELIELEQSLETTSSELGLIFNERKYKDDYELAAQIEEISNPLTEDYKERLEKIIGKIKKGKKASNQERELLNILSPNQKKILFLTQLFFQREIIEDNFELCNIMSF